MDDKPKVIAIRVEQSGVKDQFDFTYTPTTVHLSAGRRVSFGIEKGIVESLLLVFDESPFQSGERDVEVTAGHPKAETIGGAKGVFHYKALGHAKVDGKSKLVYDIWCPSIIVD